MQEIFNAIKDWPVILQGALGSAAFWVFLMSGQKLIEIGHSSTISLLAGARKSALINERIRLSTLTATGIHKPLHSSMLIYRMSRHLLKALIWMVLGNIFDSLIGVFAIIGYLGALYYLFKALDVVKPIKYDGDVQARINEINAELSSLK